MTLRTRLVLTTVGLLAVALVVALGATFGAVQDWRAAQPQAPAAAYDELTGRVAAVAAGTGAGVLALLAVATVVLVHRALRPLAVITDTASAIGAGTLNRRVGAGHPGTEVGRLGVALNAMLDRIETAMTERDRSEERLRQFVADASHELRTPLATVRGYAELFRRGAASRPHDLADAMNRIESETARMSDLVDELLLLARLDQGRPLDRDPVDLAALAAGAVDAARAIEPDRPLELRSNSAVALGDPDRLRQVLDNLLANVRAHTPHGAPATVEIRPGLVRVTDTGPGIPQRATERFWRGDGATPGSGLGLAIVAAIVTAHGGTVGIDGTTVTVRLPHGEPHGAGTG